MMNTDSITNISSLTGGNQKDSKSKPITLKLEWVFGIRNDIRPNIFLLDNETLVYPASHYIVIFNHTRNVPYNQIQQFIPGTPHSRGFVAMNVINTQKKFIVAAEEIFDGVSVSIYLISNIHGIYNYPSKIQTVHLHDIRITKVYHVAFSEREKSNSYLALIGLADDPCLVLWNWNMENLKERPTVYPLKIPSKNFKQMKISFSIYDNDVLCIVSDTFFIYYNINKKNLEEIERFNLTIKNEYGYVILSHCWLYDGSFAICTDKYIIIYDQSFKRIAQMIVTEERIIAISPHSLLGQNEGFIAAGKARTFEIYEKTHDAYEKIAEKKMFDYQLNLNEKYTGIYDKNTQGDKTGLSDRDRIFDFTSLVSPQNEQFVIASTSYNDVILINTSVKEINKSIVKHLISPFHSNSVEGMDICLNKPYLITCSTDKSVRVWDYKRRTMVIHKIFDEEMYSVAFHPSGMHAIVSSDDKITPLNIYFDEISNMIQNSISIKTKSKDMKFSHGGQFFAFDSGTYVQIYDFMNMQLYTPAPNNAHKNNFYTTTKINALSWRNDDRHLAVSGYEYIYDWKIREDHDTRPKIAQCNINSTAYLGNSTNLIIATDDLCVRKILDSTNLYTVEKFDMNLKELNIFSKSKLMACSTTNKGLDQTDSAGTSIYPKGSHTTCLRIFLDIRNKNDYIEIPAHFGETNRVRVSHDENLIFTCGSDGCINVYSLDSPLDLEDDKYVIDKISDNYTNVVLIRKTKLKERENEKRDLPEKREEKLKKIKTENQEKKEKLKRDLDAIKNKIALTKQQEMHVLNIKKNELETKEIEFERKLKLEKNQLAQAFENQYNELQIELSGASREVEAIREALRTHKIAHKEEIATMKKEAEERKQEIEREFQREKNDLQINIVQFEEKIKTLENNKLKDNQALDWLNGNILTQINNNIDELTGKIEELRVHFSHQLKKLKEEKEKLQINEDNLALELKKMNEKRMREETNKAANVEKKKLAEAEMKLFTERISEVENKIIECKKNHTYLEKCKFVLSFKIKELKKEMGPMDKMIEDLIKRTRDDEIELNKYNREHDIIDQKLVDLDDLKDKKKELELLEKKELSRINSFKTDLFNMLEFLDDYDALRAGFKKLRDSYLKSYVPETQDMELDAEFFNQKDNLQKQVNELQESLGDLKDKHITTIEDNRIQNHNLIYKIQKLKDEINLVQTCKNVIAGNKKHGSTIAAIKATENLKSIEDKEFESLEEKVRFLEELVEEKRKRLNYLRSGRKNLLPHISITKFSNKDNSDDE